MHNPRTWICTAVHWQTLACSSAEAECSHPQHPWEWGRWAVVAVQLRNARCSKLKNVEIAELFYKAIKNDILTTSAIKTPRCWKRSSNKYLEHRTHSILVTQKIKSIILEKMREMLLSCLLFKQLPPSQTAVTNDCALILGLSFFFTSQGFTCCMPHFYTSWIHCILCVSKYTYILRILQRSFKGD